MRYAIPLSLSLLLMGCPADLNNPTKTPGGATVGRLAEIDGCTVYRIEDGSFAYRYFVRCPCVAQYASVLPEQRVQHGKTSRMEQIDTPVLN